MLRVELGDVVEHGEGSSGRRAGSYIGTTIVLDAKAEGDALERDIGWWTRKLSAWAKGFREGGRGEEGRGQGRGRDRISRLLSTGRRVAGCWPGPDIFFTTDRFQ